MLLGMVGLGFIWGLGDVRVKGVGLYGFRGLRFQGSRALGPRKNDETPSLISGP